MSKQFKLPLLSCDCHTHVVGPRNKFPLLKKLIYLPQEANFNDIKNFLDQTQLKRVVLVQPSFYGTDNAYLEHSLLQLQSIARGVAVVENDISNNEIDKLHQAGVRGIRINPSKYCLIFIPNSSGLPFKSFNFAIAFSFTVSGAFNKHICCSSDILLLSYLWRTSCI